MATLAFLRRALMWLSWTAGSAEGLGRAGGSSVGPPAPGMGRGVEPCVLRCKDTHMAEMEAVVGEVGEWSVEFLMPLQTMLRMSSSANRASTKLHAACRSNTAYDDCLSACPASLARTFLSLGLGPWRFICAAYNNAELPTLLPCWKAKLEQVHSLCSEQLVQLRLVLRLLSDSPLSGANAQRRFGSLCGAIRSFDSCHHGHAEELCGRRLASFLHGLNAVTNYTVLNLMQYASVKSQVPAECSEWRLEASSLRLEPGLTKWPRAALTASLAPASVSHGQSLLRLPRCALLLSLSLALCLARSVL